MFEAACTLDIDAGIGAGASAPFGGPEVRGPLLTSAVVRGSIAVGVAARADQGLVAVVGDKVGAGKAARVALAIGGDVKAAVE